MKISQLYYILKVVEAKSMSKAADGFYVSKQNMSESITALENELDVVIFNRTSKGMSLTNDGKKIIGYAQKIVELYEMMCHVNKVENVIRLDMYTHIAAIFLPEVTKRFKNECPHCKLLLSDSVNLSESTEKLYMHQVDLALFDISQDYLDHKKPDSKYERNLDFMRIAEDEVVIVAHTSLNLSSWSDFQKSSIPVISYEYNDQLLLLRNKLNVNNLILQVSTMEMYHAMIESSEAVGFSTKMLLKNQPWRYSEDVVFLKNNIDGLTANAEIIRAQHKNVKTDTNLETLTRIIDEVVAELA